MRTRLFELLVLLIVTVAVERVAKADEAYFWVPLGDLKLVEGQLPEDRRADNWAANPLDDPLAYAALDGAGEAFVVPADTTLGTAFLPPLRRCVLVGRTAAPGEVAGRLFVPDAKGERFVPLRFTAPAKSTDGRDAFFRGKYWHYDHLVAREIPGGAWFRHQARAALRVVDPNAKEEPQDVARGRFDRPDGLDDTYALFSGGRALSENLQLDRALPPRDPGREAEEVDLSGIRGVTTQSINWKSKLDDAAKSAERDPLAKLIPHDQHAVFFPTFDAMIALADEADRYGTLGLHAVEPRSEDYRVRYHYERQLGLSLTGLGRLVGPQVVKSVALTGSDPYLRVGSDVAVLFEAKGDAAGLEKALVAQTALGRAWNPSAQPVSGEAGGVSFSGAVSKDRSVSSYVARLGNAVVVTNSKAQLERLAEAANGKVPSIDSLDEYAFFRGRYRRGQDDETAFLILTDATIRRWCGPRWRIADSRRTRVAALLADVQAQHMEALVRGQVRADNPPHVDLYVQDMGQLRVTPAGVHSSTYGSLAFMTPIVELPVDKVSGAEARAYERWRDGYETNWRQYFDPIAVRFSMRPDRSLAADMTVMPLIQGTSYRPLISVTRDASLPPNAGDPHQDALVHVAVGINPKSPTVTLGASFLANVLPGDKADLLASLGPAVAVYADDDPLWSEVASAKEPWQAFFDRIARLPLALHVELKDAGRMKDYLAGAEQWAQQSYPGYSKWEAIEHNGQSYVKITPTEQTVKDKPWLKAAALCFANTGKALVLTPREDLLKRAIDRQRKGDGAGAKAWLGTSGGLAVQAKAWDVLRQGMTEPYRQAMRRRAWANLPALNEWKRTYPDRDPLEVHQRTWHATLLDPAGGKYVWNEQWRTMESTTYGHPGEPKEGPAAPAVMESLLGAQFGLTFEPDGLRAKGAVERKAGAR